MSAAYDHSGWPRGGPLREPSAMVNMITGRYSVGWRHWDVFYDQTQESMTKHGLRTCDPRLLFYVWIQTYNAHERNIKDYVWVMGGCR